MNVSGFVFVPHGTGGSAPGTGDPAVFLTLELFMKEPRDCSHGLTGLPWLFPWPCQGHS